MGVAAVLAYVPRTMRNTAKVKMAILKEYGTVEGFKWHKNDQVTIDGKGGKAVAVAVVTADPFGDAVTKIIGKQ